LKCAWDRDQFVSVIRRSLADVDDGGAGHGGATWVLSSHDTPRHASRMALAVGVSPDAWLLADGTPPIDPDLGRRRARAATLMMLALPGSAYLFQGEELGLLEVADLPIAALHDPTWARTEGTHKGRDGCRVPLPWARTGSSFGFGSNGSWLPQPPNFGADSVEAQDGVKGSCLEMYRDALRIRRTLQRDESALEWIEPERHDVLWFRRSNGWECIVNFGRTDLAVPLERVLLASAPLSGDRLPTDTAVWLGP
jgi:alpha-glucosidase